MKIGSSKTKQCSLVTVLYWVFILTEFEYFSEVNACANAYEEHTKIYISVNVVENTLQVYWENVDSSKYYLVLASCYGVSSFHKKGEGDFEYWRNGNQCVAKTINPTSFSGLVQTGKRFDRSLLYDRVTNVGWYVYLTTPTGTAEKMYCMKIYPTWMNDFKSQIGNVSLNRLFIPGTHDSASYLTRESANDDPAKHKYFITQGWEDVRSQLRMGARYLDIRIGEYVWNERFWTVHGLVSMHTLRNVLGQVRRFVEETNEIVIFDIHRFERGFHFFYSHRDLVEFITSQIGDLMVSPSIGWGGTLNQIWATGRKIIVSYINEDAVNAYPDRLWSATLHRWGETDNKNELKNYLYDQHRYARGYLPKTDCAVLTPKSNQIAAEFTPVTSSMLTILSFGFYNPAKNSRPAEEYPGVLQNAQNINQDITLWYLHDLGRTTNIVAVDYILGTNIVEVAIHWNLRNN